MPNRAQRLVAACVLIAAGAPRALALSADEVLVVANERSAESVALAKAYAAGRGVDERNVLLIKTSTRVAIYRSDYEKAVRDQIRKALTERKLERKIRCICLMWGMPLRIVDSPAKPAAQPISPAARAAEKLHYRLVVDYRLLETVCEQFPAPRTKGLAPLALLFASPMPEPPKPLPELAALGNDLHRLLAAKQIELGRIRDPARQAIASRQLVAMHLELGGLQGLLDYIRDHRPARAPAVDDIRKQLAEIDRRLEPLLRQKPDPARLDDALALIERRSGLTVAAAYADKLDETPKPRPAPRRTGPAFTTIAALDSELALMLWDDYPLAGPAANPLHWRARGAKARQAQRVMMTARIDGPSAGDAMRIVKTSPAVEKVGLKGTFYIDAGGPAQVAYAARGAYDARLAGLARVVRARTRVRTVLDEATTLFAENACPDAALYVGWYSLQKYIPAFAWAPGAVGWHVASWEAVNLRDPTTQEWCAKMIQNGVVATVGAVREPLLTQFPDPEGFFPLLLTGKYTVAECYWRTVPGVSWQMMLIADPLYNPFKADPQLSVNALPAGLAP